MCLSSLIKLLPKSFVRIVISRGVNSVFELLSLHQRTVYTRLYLPRALLTAMAPGKQDLARPDKSPPDVSESVAPVKLTLIADSLSLRSISHLFCILMHARIHPLLVSATILISLFLAQPQVAPQYARIHTIGAGEMLLHDQNL